MTDLTAIKAAARKAAFARRKAAHQTHGPGRCGFLSSFLAGYRGVPVAGYMPIRTEIDPRPAMARHDGPVCVPVVVADATPLDVQFATSLGLSEDATRRLMAEIGFVPEGDDWRWRGRRVHAPKQRRHKARPQNAFAEALGKLQMPEREPRRAVKKRRGRKPRA